MARNVAMSEHCQKQVEEILAQFHPIERIVLSAIAYFLLILCRVLDTEHLKAISGCIHIADCIWLDSTPIKEGAD